jgi:hypothetical protein
MDSMPLTAEEKKSREIKSLAVLAKNARILAACGFVAVTDEKVRGQFAIWHHSDLEIPAIGINQHEFTCVADLVCAVHQWGLDLGAAGVRDGFKKLMRIL